MDIKLTDEQKKLILALFETNPNLNSITQIVFENNNIDGRSKEGRAISSFLKSEGKTYGTTRAKSVVSVELTPEQKQILMSDRITKDTIALEAARIVFGDDTIKPLSTQHRVVMDFLKKFRPEIVDDDETPADGNWHPPKSMVTCLRRVNKWCNVSLGDKPDNLSARHRQCLEKLLIYLQTYKLEQTINCFSSLTDRLLFESEFIRATWNKPDLTSDELNLYMMICSNHIRAKHIQKRVDNLDAILSEQALDPNNEPSMRLTELIKATNEELNGCEKRIETVTSKLNGDRSERLKKNKAENANFLFLVEEFQQKESRDRMVLMAEMMNQLVEEEADRLETMNEMKARIFGIKKDELI